MKVSLCSQLSAWQTKHWPATSQAQAQKATGQYSKHRAFTHTHTNYHWLARTANSKSTSMSYRILALLPRTAWCLRTTSTLEPTRSVRARPTLKPCRSASGTPRTTRMAQTETPPLSRFPNKCMKAGRIQACLIVMSVTRVAIVKTEVRKKTHRKKNLKQEQWIVSKKIVFCNQSPKKTASMTACIVIVKWAGTTLTGTVAM